MKVLRHFVSINSLKVEDIQDDDQPNNSRMNDLKPHGKDKR